MYATLFYGHWADAWNLNQKVTFDGVNKLILVSNGILELDVKQDLYSDWKEWTQTLDNAKYEQAFTVIGGEPLPGNRFVGATFFLINGWKIRTWEGNHTLTVNGNLFCEDGSPAFVPTIDGWTITVNSFQSTLVDGVLGLTDAQDTQLFAIPTSTLTTEEHNRLMSLSTSASGNLSPEEHAHLMSLQNALLLGDIQSIIDGVWDKVLPGTNGLTAKEYVVYKILTTNKFIGLS